MYLKTVRWNQNGSHMTISLCSWYSLVESLFVDLFQVRLQADYLALDDAMYYLDRSIFSLHSDQQTL